MKATGYSKCTVRRDVAEKSELHSHHKPNATKLIEKGSYWMISKQKHCDNLCTTSTGIKKFPTVNTVGGIEGERQIQRGAGVLMLTGETFLFII